MIGDDEKRAAYLGGGDNLIGVLSTDERHRYCSVACRDAKLPPLAAQSAEVKPSATGKPLCPTCGRLESQHTNPLAHKFGEPKKAKPAEQPKSASKAICQAAMGYCPDAPKTRIIMDYLRKKPIRVEWCDPCALAYEQHHVTTAQTGTPYAGPERLPRPRPAHSMGIDDPTLPEAR
jgi:hypothetical protein